MIRRHQIVARRAHSAECSATGWSLTCTLRWGPGASGLRARHHTSLNRLAITLAYMALGFGNQNNKSLNGGWWSRRGREGWKVEFRSATQSA